MWSYFARVLMSSKEWLDESGGVLHKSVGYTETVFDGECALGDGEEETSLRSDIELCLVIGWAQLGIVKHIRSFAVINHSIHLQYHDIKTFWNLGRISLLWAHCTSR